MYTATATPQASPELASDTVVAVEGVDKTFTLHLRDGQRIRVVRGLTFEARRGECLVLSGASGAGKSSVLKMIYGTYSADAGRILVRHDGGVIDIASAAPRRILEARQRTMGYVSQFLRALPRVSTLDIVAEPLLNASVSREESEARATALLERLDIPERQWSLPPATFSGGEQQRVNIARALVLERPLVLLDEPTASLDAVNRSVVIDLIRERRDAGACIVAVFHDAAVRDALADRIVDVTVFGPASEEGA